MINTKLRNTHFSKMKKYNLLAMFMDIMFIDIYEWLIDTHPTLFLVFIMVIIPILSVFLLMLLTLLLTAPFIFAFGW